MSLLWRRATIFALLGITLVAGLRALFAIRQVVGDGGVLFQSWSLPLAWLGFALFLLLATLTFYDGRRLSHVLIFNVGALGLAASIAAGSLVWMGAAGLPALLALVASSVAYITRERDAPTTLASYYAAAVKARRIRQSDEQLIVVQRLDEMGRSFRSFERRRRLPWAFLLSAPRGVYLFGAAGRGKSFLLDGMFDTLGSRAKRRFHFHELMTAITHELHRAQGQTKAGRRVARQLAPRASLVLVDEINLVDLGSAALFAPVLEAWWRMDCVVCMSSNQSVDWLFTNLPHRAQLEKKFLDHTEVLEMPGGVDYRMGKLTGADLYQYPADSESDARVAAIVDMLAESEIVRDPIAIGGRQIAVRARSLGVAWFAFADLCETATGFGDYLKLVSDYANIVISGVPRLTNIESARRFSWLVELVYDRRKRLIVGAAVPLTELFAALPESAGEEVDFQKIASRLAEMQSTEYSYSLGAGGEV